MINRKQNSKDKEEGGKRIKTKRKTNKEEEEKRQEKDEKIKRRKRLWSRSVNGNSKEE